MNKNRKVNGNEYTANGFHLYLKEQIANHDLSVRQVFENIAEYADKVLEAKGTGYKYVLRDLEFMLKMYEERSESSALTDDEAKELREKVATILKKNGCKAA